MPKALWILRIGVFGTFLGHGVFAFMKNPGWFPFLEFWGFDQQQIEVLMPIIGIVDIGVALSTLLKPSKYVLLYAVVWAFMTALMRPLVGGSWWDFVERAANWAAPLALYLWYFKLGQGSDSDSKDVST
jgi:hypothetical protein